MADPSSRRINRIHSATIDVLFRDEIALDTRDVWREDDLYDSSGSMFRVLDFGTEERIVDPSVDEADQEWAPTGRVLVEIQRLDATGAGLSEPTFKEVAGEEGAVIAWYGWRLDPRSPRRPEPADPPEHPDTATQTPIDEVCLMCGSSEVIYHDADGSPRCKQHIGESPEEPELTETELEADRNAQDARAALDDEARNAAERPHPNELFEP